MSHEAEEREGPIAELVKWNDAGLVPAIAQCSESGRVLMMAWMNAESLAKTLETGRAHYFSRSRQRLWMKGESSGHVQEVESLSVDCDGDTLLLRIRQTGAACHTGRPSCFYRSGAAEGDGDMRHTPEAPGPMLERVYRVIESRRDHPNARSYVASLFAKGPEKMRAKVDEEATEVIEASQEGDRAHFVHEIADLWFHCLVLMAAEGVRPEEIDAELQRRFGRSGIEEKESRGT